MASDLWLPPGLVKELEDTQEALEQNPKLEGDKFIDFGLSEDRKYLLLKLPKAMDHIFLDRTGVVEFRRKLRKALRELVP